MDKLLCGICLLFYNKDNKQMPEKFKKYDLVIAVLAAAILISGSVFYNTNVIVKKIEGISATQVAKPLAQNQIQNQNQNKVNTRTDAPTTGNKNAKVTVIEFSDIQCPFCENFASGAFKEIKNKYIDTGKILFIFRHFPLTSLHQNAQKAAEAAECANKQGKFFQYHDLLFSKGGANGTGLDIVSLKQYAKDLGLNQAQFNNCLDSGAAASAVTKDISDATSAGVSGTPTLFVNAEKIVGAQPFSVFEQAIEEALK
ncbi:MAG: DsbA family protein [Candidatus Parcubacteria bacterium]|nr:DsbA family protein [Candidatus Parcubacteria bacterium]